MVTHHRGAYLNAIGDILVWNMGLHPTYLWTLPMFHCNGWCFPWAVTLQAGTQVCLRRVEPAAIYAIAEHQVTHLCGAPVVMGMLINATPEQRRDFDHQVNMMTAAAAPPAAVLQRMAELGIRITHAYGLTEVYGPATVCAWQEGTRCRWTSSAHAGPPGRALPGARRPRGDGPATMTPVPRDGQTIGEIMMRGHDVMKGYLQGRQGDRGGVPGRLVPHRRSRRDARGRLHRDQGPLQGHHHLGRREHLLDRGRGRPVPPPAVLEAAVVARPDDKWGESPCAFVTLKEGAAATERDLIDHCRGSWPVQMPEDGGVHRAAQDLDGKVQKNVLRERAKAL